MAFQIYLTKKIEKIINNNHNLEEGGDGILNISEICIIEK